MKFQCLLIGLAFSLTALADGVKIDQLGKVAVLSGSSKSSSAEVLELMATSYELGLKNSRGTDIFAKTEYRQGLRTFVSYKNKNLSSSRDAAFTVIYQVALKGKSGDITVDSEAEFVTVKGKAANVLMGALISSIGVDRNGPLGVGLVQTKSGRIMCSKVVAPRAVATCTLAL